MVNGSCYLFPLLEEVLTRLVFIAMETDRGDHSKEPLSYPFPHTPSPHPEALAGRGQLLCSLAFPAGPCQFDKNIKGRSLLPCQPLLG